MASGNRINIGLAISSSNQNGAAMAYQYDKLKVIAAWPVEHSFQAVGPGEIFA